MLSSAIVVGLALFVVADGDRNWAENKDRIQSELLLKAKISGPRARLPTECPKYDSINETVLLPHESDCTKFYICSHQKKVLKQCPEMDEEGNRLYFNFEEQICDWPWNVDCKLPKPIMRAGPIKQILPVPTACPATDSPEYTVHLAHEWDCTKFYKCFQGEKYLFLCPKILGTDARLHFNRVEQVCGWPWTAGCNSEESTQSPPITRPPPTTRPSPTSQPPPTTQPPRTTQPPPTTQTHETTTADPEIRGCLGSCPNYDPPNFITALAHADCRKWCRCENHNVKVTLCPGKLHFSPTLKVCTLPELAGCKGKNYIYRSRGANSDDEALMNILGYKKRAQW